VSVRSSLAAVAVAVLLASACSAEQDPPAPYGAQGATMGESLAVLGWNMSVSNLRFDGEFVLIDVDAAPSEQGAPHADPKDIRFGLYGALAHPLEANAIGGCRDVTDLAIQPLSVTPDRLTGTACLGPLRDQSQVRGVYVYSPRDRTAGTTMAFPAAYPVGIVPAKDTDTGLSIETTSVDAFRADGDMLNPTALGDPEAFTGDGYMLLGLEISGLATQYRDVSAQRGGPTRGLVSPTRPAPGLSRACDVYGASVLVLPEASRDAVQVNVSLCSQGEINEALLSPSVSLIGTHAGLWTTVEAGDE
jgi:hypothetical protein